MPKSPSIPSIHANFPIPLSKSKILPIRSIGVKIPAGAGIYGCQRPNFPKISYNIGIMPLPALILPLSITIASAIVQLGGKLQARRKIQDAQRRLATRRQQHTDAIAELRRRQSAAKARAISGNIAIPSALLRSEPRTYASPDAAPRRWPSFLSFLSFMPFLRFGQPVLRGKVQSRKRIIAPKVFSTTASLVHKANPAIAGRLTQFVIGAMPEFSVATEFSAAAAGKLASVGGRAASVGGRAALLGGRTASAAAAGPGPIIGRFALVGFTVIGYIISPLMAGLSIYLDVRRVRKAQRELAHADAAMTDLETQAAAQTLELERVTAQGLLALSAPAPSAPRQ